MNQKYTFHKSVRGHLHIMRDIPCEDCSGSFSEENGRYYIAVVADGHGAAECFRSSFGSQAATEIAMKCLKEFAESVLVSQEMEEMFYKGIVSNPRFCQTTIRRLTDTIIAGWHDCILENYRCHPPTAEELGDYADKYRNETRIPHIYGTTLMAALQFSDCLLLLHQGDGRCDVFYADGSVDQPIPWDERCEDAAVTSMCDKDAADSIRSYVIDLKEKEVIACYLGCDGVEDAYRDTYEALGGTHGLMGGVHAFYKDLTCQIAALETTEFEEYIETMFSEFSATGRFSHSGSGDDVSVAGIVDRTAIRKVTDRFKLDVKRYELEEALFWKEEELRGKLRKHEILRKRMEAAETEVKQQRGELERLEQSYEEAKKAFEEYDATCKEIEKEIQEIKKALEEYDAKCKEIEKEAQEIPAELDVLQEN